MSVQNNRLLARMAKLNDAEIEQALASGELDAGLELYLGRERLKELRELATEANTKRIRSTGPKVFLLPGIMGSKIGTDNDLIWIDPFDIEAGKLENLAFPYGNRYHATGVLLLFYLKMKLTFRLHRFRCQLFPFDWRKSLFEAGQALLDTIRDEEAVHLVAHSMGGLVVRAALRLAQGSDGHIKKVVMLGTPNHGSFAALEALRGTHSILRRIIDPIDHENTAKELADRVFSTFAGLCELLPAPEKSRPLNLFDRNDWPEGPAPSQELLTQASTNLARLADADERFYLIAGTGRNTLVSAHKADRGFVYTENDAGDGTVPLDMAQLPGTKTFFTKASHGSLPNNGRVTRAVIDLLRSGDTNELPDSFSPTRGSPRQVLESQAFTRAAGTDPTGLEGKRRLLHEFLTFSKPEAECEPSVPVGRLDSRRARRIVVSRMHKQRLEIDLCFGDLTEVDAEAYLLGLYKKVLPGGAATAIDRCLDGAISEFVERRMINGGVGQIFVLPAGRHALPARVVLFAGLGPFDQLGDEVIRIAAENAMRMLAKTFVDHCATVLPGVGSGRSIARTVRVLLEGIFRGFGDHEHRVRRITLVEHHVERYEELREAIFDLSRTALFDDIEVTIEESRPSRRRLLRAPPTMLEEPSPTYLLVREVERTQETIHLGASVLTAGEKATMLSRTIPIDRRTLENLLKRLEDDPFSSAVLKGLGKDLGELVVHEDVSRILRASKERYLIIAHDTPSSRIPWETIAFGRWSPALEGGLSRLYFAENLSVAKWLEARRRSDQLKVLVVVNPTEDLDGAEAEGDRLLTLFGGRRDVVIETLRGKHASRDALLDAFTSGRFDVVHYAGHAFFEPEDRARCGILCHGNEVITGRDLAKAELLPSLVFFNACESGRVRRSGGGHQPAAGRTMALRRLDEAVSTAEALLRGGVANFIGTYWPVSDAAAKKFSEAFYGAILRGESIGQALHAGRQKIRRHVDWADYIHYGNHNFRLKKKKGDRHSLLP